MRRERRREASFLKKTKHAVLFCIYNIWLKRNGAATRAASYGRTTQGGDEMLLGLPKGPEGSRTETTPHYSLR